MISTSWVQSIKQLRLEQKAAAQQQQLIAELETLVKSIERCERTILDLKTELESVNQKHQDRNTTQDDIAYLTDLLRCAQKKLSWEKQLASLKKRTPPTLAKVSALMTDPKNPLNEQTATPLLETLQRVQVAIARLEAMA